MFQLFADHTSCCKDLQKWSAQLWSWVQGRDNPVRIVGKAGRDKLFVQSVRNGLCLRLTVAIRINQALDWGARDTGTLYMYMYMYNVSWL